jgi:hypothetical protein
VAKKAPKPERPDPAAALAKLERPQVRWKIIAQIVLGFAVVWALAIGLMPWLGIWGVVGASVLSAVAIGFGIWILRLMRKSAGIVDILKTATDEAGRKAALEKLAAREGDAMAALARAQLVAQEKPFEAIEILEAVDLKKAGMTVEHDVRANLAMLYLMVNRTREARELADQIRLDKQAQAKSRALYAAVMSEAFARTGKADEAKTMLETYDANDPELREIRPLLLRARAYTFVATKNRGLARKAVEDLAAIDPNMVAAFLQKGGNMELAKIAREIAQTLGVVPKQKIKMRMK